MTGIFDPAIFDSNIFDVDEPVTTSSGGRVPHPVKDIRFREVTAETKLHGTVLRRVEELYALSGYVHLPAEIETALKGTVLMPRRDVQLLKGDVRRGVQHLHELGGDVLQARASEHQLTGSLALRSMRKQAISALLCGEEELALYWAMQIMKGR